MVAVSKDFMTVTLAENNFFIHVHLIRKAVLFCTAFFVYPPKDFILKIILTNFATWHAFWLLITERNVVVWQ